MPVSDFTSATWRKSTFSGGGNDCVELAVAPDGAAVRDSKNPVAGHLVVGRNGWSALLSATIDGQLANR